MTVSVLMPSYNRPRLLGSVVAQFLAQDYAGDMEIIVLEDSGVFGDQTIDFGNWTLISTTARFKSVGAKRNELTRLASGEYLITADDDDTYFPWHVSAAVNALQKACYCQPRQALEWDSPTSLGRYWVVSEPIRQKLAANARLDPNEALDICYGGQWSFRKKEVFEAGGYPENVGNGDDTRLCRHMVMKYGNSADAICPEFPKPSYVYSRHMSGSWHASELGPGTAPLQRLADMPRASRDELVVELPGWYRTIEIPETVKPRKW